MAVREWLLAAVVLCLGWSVLVSVALVPLSRWQLTPRNRKRYLVFWVYLGIGGCFAMVGRLFFAAGIPYSAPPLEELAFLLLAAFWPILLPWTLVVVAGCLTHPIC